MLKVKKLSPTAILPTRSTAGSVGYDLYIDPAVEQIVVLENDTAICSTGISVELPQSPLEGHEYVFKVEARSGLSFKNDIEIGAGVVDPDYRGEIKIKVYNTGKKPFTLRGGDRVAQGLLLLSYIVPVQEVNELNLTTRGENGFGSSGR
jgi:dUTP pyrophosphatase